LLYGGRTPGGRRDCKFPLLMTLYKSVTGCRACVSALRPQTPLWTRSPALPHRRDSKWKRCPRRHAAAKARRGARANNRQVFSRRRQATTATRQCRGVRRSRGRAQPPRRHPSRQDGPPPKLAQRLSRADSRKKTAADPGPRALSRRKRRDTPVAEPLLRLSRRR